MDEKTIKELYQKHRLITRGLHLYKDEEGNLAWSVEDTPNAKRVCRGISQFDKGNRCMRCLEYQARAQG